MVKCWICRSNFKIWFVCDTDFCFDANFLQFGGSPHVDGIGQAE